MTNSTQTIEPLLEVDGLTVDIDGGQGTQRILHGVSFQVRAGEALGLVGESGSGKSMALKAIDRILPPTAGRTGAIRVRGQEIGSLDRGGLRQFPKDVAMIFQDPRVAVNPIRSIGDYVIEGLVTNEGVPPREARRRAVEMLGRVKIPDGERRLKQHPHELSGGAAAARGDRQRPADGSGPAAGR
ncbi:ATP-binding cassette domain-containing protein [Nesterenkonia suensis]